MNRKIYKDGTFIWYNKDYDTIERKRKDSHENKEIPGNPSCGLDLSFILVRDRRGGRCTLG